MTLEIQVLAWDMHKKYVFDNLRTIYKEVTDIHAFML